MNKAEFISAITDKTNLSKAGVEQVVNAYAETVAETLKSGDKIQLVGFGTWEKAERAARTGHNPQTGETMQIPATAVPKFKPGKKLKEAIQ